MRTLWGRRRRIRKVVTRAEGGRGCVPNIDADLHPALPIRQRLNDEFVLVVGREVGAVMLQPVHDEVAFLSRKESGGSRVLSAIHKNVKKRNGT